MPRQKKNTMYTPNTEFTETQREAQKFMWEKRKEYTLQQLLDWNTTYYTNNHDGSPNDTAVTSIIENFSKRLTTLCLDDSNWRDGDYYSWPISQMMQNAFYVSPWFDEINTAFLAEYDSREDLQKVYTMFYEKTNWITDRYDRSYSLNAYHRGKHETAESVKARRDMYAARPESFVMWMSVIDRAEVAKFIELERETPYQPGDLVKLRTAFIGREKYDPLYVSNYDVYARGMAPTPDKKVDRIGTLMAVTDQVKGWRGAKGSKMIEVMWIGQETTCFLPERALKWEERPTYKNGMKKRQ